MQRLDLDKGKELYNFFKWYEAEAMMVNPYGSKTNQRLEEKVVEQQQIQSMGLPQKQGPEQKDNTTSFFIWTCKRMTTFLLIGI